MAFASGAFHGMRYIKESTFGVTPPTPQMKNLRHTSCSLVLSKDSFQSQELRSDAQISDLRQGNKQAQGDIGIEFSFGEFDEFLAAAVRSSWTPSSEITGASSVLKAGTTMQSFTLERVFGDIQQYETFTGCRVNTFSISVQPNAMVTGTISIVGKNIGFSDSPLSASPIASQTAPPFDGFSGTLEEGGEKIAVVTGIDLSIANSLEAAFVIGEDSAEDIIAGRINITGTISAYFENMDLLEKFVNETETSLSFGLGNWQDGNSYQFHLPRIKYSGGDNPVDGEGPITLSMPFQALYDPCAKTNIIVFKSTAKETHPCTLTYNESQVATLSDEPVRSIMVTLSGGDVKKTFNGRINETIPGVTFEGVPAGCEAEITKVSDTEAMITFRGTPLARTTGGEFSVKFSAACFVMGFCQCPGEGVQGLTQSFSI